MTRRDYEAFAEMFAMLNVPLAMSTDYGYGYEDGYKLAVKEIKAAVIGIFEQDNPRFDADKFETATIT